MFSRRSHDQAEVSTDEIPDDDFAGTTRVAAQVEKKGRPTPSRKDAQAAAAARASVPRTRKEQVAAQRASRGTATAKVKQAMRTGDERFFLARDKGPVRRFVRDLVDARLGFAQLLFPLMVLTILMSTLPSAQAKTMGSTIQLGAMVLVVGDLAFLRWRVRREVRRRFPDASLQGLTWYALSRSIYPKFLRRGAGMVRPEVKIGEALPERYR